MFSIKLVKSWTKTGPINFECGCVKRKNHAAWRSVYIYECVFTEDVSLEPCWERCASVEFRNFVFLIRKADADGAGTILGEIVNYVRFRAEVIFAFAAFRIVSAQEGLWFQVGGFGELVSVFHGAFDSECLEIEIVVDVDA